MSTTDSLEFDAARDAVSSENKKGRKIKMSSAKSVEVNVGKNSLLKSLLEFHKKFQGVKKGSVNPQFRSKYADITSILDAIIEPLAAEGLMITQLEEPSTLTTQKAEGDRIELPGPTILRTILMHESGGELVSVRAIPDALWVNAPNKAQAYQSAITYARRGAIVSMLAIPQYDDDAQATGTQTPEQAVAAHKPSFSSAAKIADTAKREAWLKEQSTKKTKAVANAAAKPAATYPTEGDAQEL